MKHEVVQSTAYSPNTMPASNLLILSEKDALDEDTGMYNYWLAQEGKSEGQGFKIKVDTCARVVAGCQIKNVENRNYATKDFRLSVVVFNM